MPVTYDKLGQLRDLARNVLKMRSLRPVHLSKMSTNPRGLLQGLIRRLAESKSSEEEIALDLLGESRSSSSYRRLKSEAKTRLLNTLFRLDLRKGGHSQSSQLRYEVDKLVFVSRVLLAIGVRGLAIQTAQRGQKLSMINHFTDSSIEFTRILREHAAQNGSIQRHRYYNRLLEKQINAYAAELVSHGFVERLTMRYSTSTSEKPQLAAIASDFADKTRRLFAEHQTYALGLAYHRLSALSAQIGLNFKMAIASCDDAIAFIDKYPEFDQRLRLGEFSLKKLVCSIHLRDYAAGKEAMKEATGAFREGSNNWFVVQEYCLLLLTHTSMFEEAFDLVRVIIAHPRFTAQPGNRRNKWQLFEIYLRFVRGELRDVGALKLNRNQLRALKRIPEYSSDKEGYNVSLLILQILYYLQNKKTSAIVDRIDALKKYRSRYLRESQNRQSSSFFKFLLDVERVSFDPIRAAEAAAKNSLGLSRPSGEASVVEGVQVIPYDYLCKVILERLPELKNIT